MSTHTATVEWTRDGAVFSDGRYRRAHAWRFDGGAVVRASASPHVVPVPLSDPAGVDPEEAFVASLSSCHMLWFLALAADRGFVVDSYVDEAVGVMAPNHEGKLAITRVTLRPAVSFSGPRAPTADELRKLHHRAHEECFLARSVRTDVVCEPVPT
ncbi:MAG TPA: OsmC family protein [Anaeromyxobacter sp.]